LAAQAAQISNGMQPNKRSPKSQVDASSSAGTIRKKRRPIRITGMHLGKVVPRRKKSSKTGEEQRLLQNTNGMHGFYGHFSGEASSVFLFRFYSQKTSTNQIA
jgi:hypothetical protein